MSGLTVRESENVSLAVSREHAVVEDFVLSWSLTRVDGLFDMEFERTEFSDDTYGVIGRALAYAEKFEGDCQALGALLGMKEGSVSLDDEQSFKDFANKIDRQSLGNHVQEIAKRLELPRNTTRKLGLARRARNYIVHEICRGIQFDAETERGRQRLLDEVSDATRRMAVAHLVVLAVMSILTKGPLPNKVYLKSYCDRVVEWVCCIEKS